MTIGDRIKTTREKMGYSQTELAEKIGVSKQTLYKYENNIVTNIPSTKIELLAEKLEVSEMFLMGWQDQEIMIEAMRDNLLTGLSDRVKEYALRLGKLSEEQQDGIFNMIDLMIKKEGKE